MRKQSKLLSPYSTCLFTGRKKGLVRLDRAKYVPAIQAWQKARKSLLISKGEYTINHNICKENLWHHSTFFATLLIGSL